MHRIVIVLCLVALGLGQPAVVQAQCPPVDGVVFPLDTPTPQLTQAFATRNVRFHGRYHIGEDWIGERGATLGLAVLAAANGRVTFASPTAWGSEDGMVILEHRLPDGSTVYGVYGHLTEAFGQAFPAPLTCVRAGDVIGSVAEVLPAPHLHWEIRSTGSDTPGAGYSWRHPAFAGLQSPARWLAETGTMVHPAFRWRADATAITGVPIMQLGGDALALDGRRVIGLSFDGRILWRYILERDAVGLLPHPAGTGALIIYADGSSQPIDAGGTLGTSTLLPHPVSAAFSTGGRAYLAAPGVPPGAIGLIAYDPGLSTALWALPLTAPPVAVQASADGTRVAVLTTTAVGTARIDWLDASTGQLLDQAELREPGTLAVRPPDAGIETPGVIAYTLGGLWQIAPDGTWALLLPTAAGGGRSGAVAWGDAGVDDGWTYTFTGTTLTAWNRQGVLQWTGDLPGTVTGAAWLREQDDRLYLIAGERLIILNAATGGICTTVPLWQDGGFAALWADLGADGTLRIATGGRLTGLDLATLGQACG